MQILCPIATSKAEKPFRSVVLPSHSFSLVIFIDSQNGLSWRGLLEIIQSNPSAIGRDTFLALTPSNLALNTSRDGAATASLVKLRQVHNTLIVKNFILTCFFYFETIAPCPFNS